MSWDHFFYYGQNPSKEEAKMDLYELLIQPKRSLFYSRGWGAGLSKYENLPNSVHLQILARYDIAQTIAKRNVQVSDGSNGTQDRRIAVSQQFISFETKGGQLNVNVLYFLFSDYENIQEESFQVG